LVITLNGDHGRCSLLGFVRKIDSREEVIVMSRDKCACENHREFNGEVAIHFPGIKGLQKPVVWLFPKVRVCLDCGYADFTIPEIELSVLVTGVPVGGAMVSTPGEEIA
jgi:hypothetical protein